MPSLNIWMNGEPVGEWTTTRGGTSIFRYLQAWTASPNARALSLSLPVTADREIRGPVVDHYFDNLLPDNPNIRRRIRERFGLRSTDAFDLLEAIGRDCAGAVQLLPPGDSPVHWNRIDATPLSSKDLEATLRNVAAPPPGHRTDDTTDFRISIAGAQEKTALLRMGAAWYRPRGATPTTHILKLPLGIIGNFRGDFSNSVENEWLCSQILRQLELPIANTQMATFGTQKALVVERFDRRWIGVARGDAQARGFVPATDVWIARLPQEDFCQATGRPPTQRYESDGGPSVNEILEILGNSAAAERDRANFVLAQLVFWLLAATDGHGKNFSIHLLPGGAFAMTPLYDVLSAWPVIGRGRNQLPMQDAKLAMAMAGKSRHYKLVEIQPRHWQALALRTGGGSLWGRMQDLVESVPNALDQVGSRLPRNFPDPVISRIDEGMRGQARKFLTFKPQA
ncbi:MAG TPA: type II toxin-antitoxin system HipA family toxin [Steroidobacteraceae bacterium]|nr:type II toxin-antitoxin system HipA family toxin [Steroidobacteraceae bacterium]